MVEKVRVRVSMEGKNAKYDLFVNGFKSADLDYMDVLALALNATSALRWSLPNNADDMAAIAMFVREGGLREDWAVMDEGARLHYRLQATTAAMA